MFLYSLDFPNLETSQLNLQKKLIEGSFSVNRTGKSLASVPVNMTLEQTANANAKSRLKGTMAFGDISMAVNQWIVTSSMKSKILKAHYILC